MKNMQNNKSPGSDGLTKEFYKGFCDEIKELFIASVTETIYFQTNTCLWLYTRKIRLFFISNSLQEVITHVDFFVAFSTDHSPVIISISKSKNRFCNRNRTQR